MDPVEKAFLTAVDGVGCCKTLTAFERQTDSMAQEIKILNDMASLETLRVQLAEASSRLEQTRNEGSESSMDLELEVAALRVKLRNTSNAKQEEIERALQTSSEGIGPLQAMAAEIQQQVSGETTKPLELPKMSLICMKGNTPPSTDTRWTQQLVKAAWMDQIIRCSVKKTTTHTHTHTYTHTQSGQCCIFSRFPLCVCVGWGVWMWVRARVPRRLPVSGRTNRGVRGTGGGSRLPGRTAHAPQPTRHMRIDALEFGRTSPFFLRSVCPFCALSNPSSCPELPVGRDAAHHANTWELSGRHGVSHSCIEPHETGIQGSTLLGPDPPHCPAPTTCFPLWTMQSPRAFSVQKVANGSMAHTPGLSFHPSPPKTETGLVPVLQNGADWRPISFVLFDDSTDEDSDTRKLRCPFFLQLCVSVRVCL